MSYYFETCWNDSIGKNHLHEILDRTGKTKVNVSNSTLRFVTKQKLVNLLYLSGETEKHCLTIESVYTCMAKSVLCYVKYLDLDCDIMKLTNS